MLSQCLLLLVQSWCRGWVLLASDGRVRASLVCSDGAAGIFVGVSGCELVGVYRLVIRSRGPELSPLVGCVCLCRLVLVRNPLLGLVVYADLLFSVLRGGSCCMSLLIMPVGCIEVDV